MTFANMYECFIKWKGKTWKYDEGYNIFAICSQPSMFLKLYKANAIADQKVMWLGLPVLWDVYFYALPHIIRIV